VAGSEFGLYRDGDASPDTNSGFEEYPMNWDQIQGNWKQVAGKVRETWGKITDDDFERIAGQRDQLIGAIQQRYGVAKEEAEKQVRRFEDTFH
jgi:uncharacterized protein YjbJ (UPF0337 family)